MSATDLQGRIIYANQAFVDVSGYNRLELLGQPHNLIRHPDMPEEGYRDLWDTIQHGKPWSAVVKNRRKSGHYYWTRANVTPLIKGDEITGYLSVRTEPSREEVAAFDALYARMRNEVASGKLTVHLKAAQVHEAGLWPAVRRAVAPDTSAWLQTMVLVVSAASFAAGVLGTSVAAGSSAWTTLGLGLGCLAACTFAVRPVIRHLVGAPVERALAFANRMAAGNLTQSMPANGNGLFAELANSLNQLSVNLRAVVTDTRHDAQHLKDAISELAAGNQDLASRTESQAASLEETSTSVTQVTGTVRDSAQAASEGSRMAASATHVAEVSSANVSQMTQTMHAISSASEHIGEIIQVIESIAFQTNILALNAAVEAARAGDHGRGFAVVASEVRALAQRTSDAAKEVKELISQSARTVEAGNVLTDTAARSIQDVLQAVQQVSTVVNRVSQSSQEQLTGISQISDAMAHMDQLTQSNAKLVQEVAIAAGQLQDRATALTETVQLFQLDDSSGSNRPDAVALRKAAKAQRERV